MHSPFVTLLIESTREVFETMSFLDIAPKAPIDHETRLQGIEITSQVGLAGEISGLLGIHCSRAFAAVCARLITGEDMEKPSDAELMDTIGEISNMIAGTLKRKMSARVDLFDISLPSVILSPSHCLYYKGCKENFPRLIIPFTTEDNQTFYSELLYHKR